MRFFLQREMSSLHALPFFYPAIREQADKLAIGPTYYCILVI
jgi:hypothetical protein